MRNCQPMNKSILAIVLCFASAGALAGGGGMSKDAYEAAKSRLEATRDAELKACDGTKGNAKDICRTEAKGRAKVALAELKAEYEPSPEADRAMMMAQADADYDVARQKCDDASGKAKDTCKARAEHVREAAIRRAKIERVEATRRLKAKGATQAREREEPTPEQKYAAEKARCGMLGDERDSCMAEVKRRFGKG
jgi:hypothetical protein